MENDKDDSRKSADQVIIDLARRAMATSLKSLLSTEEGIRNIISAVLPKDLIRELLLHIGGQFDEFRKDLVETLGQEIRHFGDTLDIAEETKKILDGLELEINIKLALKDNKHKKSSKTSTKAKKKKT